MAAHPVKGGAVFFKDRVISTVFSMILDSNRCGVVAHVFVLSFYWLSISRFAGNNAKLLKV